MTVPIPLGQGICPSSTPEQKWPKKVMPVIHKYSGWAKEIAIYPCWVVNEMMHTSTKTPQLGFILIV
jgi:hypothetical protein